jgi:hypothetical protein
MPIVIRPVYLVHHWPNTEARELESAEVWFAGEIIWDYVGNPSVQTPVHEGAQQIASHDKGSDNEDDEN